MPRSKPPRKKSPAVNHVARVDALLSSLSQKYFSITPRQLAKNRSHSFWILGIDDTKQEFTSLSGKVSSATLKKLTPNPYYSSDGGYRASAQTKVDTDGIDVDIFLINTRQLGMDNDRLGPLLVHELCHMIEQTTTPPHVVFDNKDIMNGQAILDSLNIQTKRLHTVDWANLMAWAARISKEKFGAQSTVSYLEAAIPPRDRSFWDPNKIVE